MNTVFVNPERCIGCMQCESACAVAHSQTKNLFLAVFESPSPRPRIHVEPGARANSSFPTKCRHCDPAPCQYVCPTAAIARSADFPETVLINARKCIACGMCAVVCPFEAITFHPSMAAPERPLVAVKCDHCLERQQQGLVPACVDACKTGALAFGELNELVKEARLRFAGSVWQILDVTNLGKEAEQVHALPPVITSWRSMGEAISHLNANGKKEREV